MNEIEKKALQNRIRNFMLDGGIELVYWDRKLESWKFFYWKGEKEYTQEVLLTKTQTTQ